MFIVNQFNAIKDGGKNLDESFFMIIEKEPIERVDDIEGKFAKLRQIICKIRININSLAYTIIKSKFFEAISLMVIVANSVSLAIEDPTS